MDTNKVRAEFEAAFVEEEVRLLSEGFRSSALHMLEQNTVNVRSAWWAWQATREAVLVELPEPESPESYGITQKDDPEQYQVLESRMGAQFSAIFKCKRAIEAQGLKVAP